MKEEFEQFMDLFDYAMTKGVFPANEKWSIDYMLAFSYINNRFDDWLSIAKGIPKGSSEDVYQKFYTKSHLNEFMTYYNSVILPQEEDEPNTWVKAGEQKSNVSVHTVKPISSSNPPIEKRTKEAVMAAFNGMNRKKGWEYAFKQETEYNFFVDLLCLYFEQKQYDLPKLQITTQKRCKTRLAAVLGMLHRDLSNTEILKNDREYFDIIRILAAFENRSDLDIYGDITK